MEVVQVRGVVESLTWDERGVGMLKFTDPSVLPVYIKELQKPELPKDLKKGDTVTVTGSQGEKYLFLLNMKRGEAASPEETGSASSIQNLRPPAEQPPKTELAVSLKEKLDEIDSRVANQVRQDLVEALLKIEVGMWEKGRVISEWVAAK